MMPHCFKSMSKLLNLLEDVVTLPLRVGVNAPVPGRVECLPGGIVDVLVVFRGRAVEAELAPDIPS